MAGDRLEVKLLLGYLRPHRGRVTVLTGLLVASSVLPLLGPALLGKVIDGALGDASVRRILTLAIAYLVVGLASQALSYVVVSGSVRIAWRAGNALRADLADRVLGLDLAWHGDHTAGVLIERVDGDVDAVAGFFQDVVLHVIGNVFVLLGVLAITFAVDWRIGLALTALALVATTMLVKAKGLAVPANEANREASAVLYGDLEERLAGLEDLRANGAGGYAVHRLLTNEHRVFRTARRASIFAHGGYAITSLTFAAGAVLTLALALVFHANGSLSAGTVYVLYRYTQLVRNPLERIAEQLRQFQKAVAGARRASRVLRTTSTLPVVDEPVALPAGPLEVRFRSVGFHYADDRIPVLESVNLTIPAGMSLGVVGRTGCGKTTMGRLLVRLWDPTEGAVVVGGVDLRDADPVSVRRRTAVVTQDVHLVTGTVRDNLTLFGALPGDDSRLQEVLRDVGLGRWLDAVGGLDGHIAGGGGLSAGEAQLIAFARAFLAEPGLVLLDEASSRLDPETERLIEAATDRLLEGRTAVVIAHRLGTLDRVDEVLVLEKGRIVEHGSRTHLAALDDSRWAALLSASEAAAA